MAIYFCAVYIYHKAVVSNIVKGEGVIVGRGVWKLEFFPEIIGNVFVGSVITEAYDCLVVASPSCIIAKRRISLFPSGCAIIKCLPVLAIQLTLVIICPNIF